MEIPRMLAEFFTCTPTATSKWVRLELKDGYAPPGFSSNRIGKWSSSGNVEFVIGSTEAGRAVNLDQTFRNILDDAGVEIVDQPSTSGSGAVYPSFDLSKVNDATAQQIFSAVSAAVRAVL